MQFISIKREQSVAQSPTLKSQEDRISQHNSHRLRLFEQHRLSDLSVSVWEMAAGPGSATVERFIVGAQKSTNQLKGCAGRATSGCWTRRSRRSRIPWQRRRRGGPPVRHHGFAFSSARVSAARRAGHAAIAMAEFYWCRCRRRPRRRRRHEISAKEKWSTGQVLLQIQHHFSAI